MGWASTYEDIIERAVESRGASRMQSIHVKDGTALERMLRQLAQETSDTRALISDPPRGAWEQHLANLAAIVEILTVCKGLDYTEESAYETVLRVHRRLQDVFERTTLYGTFTRTSIAAIQRRSDTIRRNLKLLQHLRASSQSLQVLEAEAFAVLQQVEGSLFQHLRLSAEVRQLWATFVDAFDRTARRRGHRPTLRNLTTFFLSENQERLVTMDHLGAFRIQGASGSGKTSILIHRALRIAKETPAEYVRVFTVNRSLAKYIEEATVDLYGPLPENVSIAAIYDFLVKALSLYEDSGKYRLVDDRSGERATRSWQEFSTRETGWFCTQEGEKLVRYLEKSAVDPYEYLLDELHYIQGAFTRSKRRAAYLEASRTGRSIPLPKEARLVCLRLLQEWVEWLQAGDLCDLEGASSAASRYFLNRQRLPLLQATFPTDHVFIDEFQDISTLELLMLKNLVRSGQKKLKNKWFLVGDVSQKIYARHIDSRRAGFNFQGKSRILNRNYRNTVEILQSAYLVADRHPPQADEPLEIITPEYSSYHGERPLICQFSHSRHLPALLTMTRLRTTHSLAIVSENVELLGALCRNLIHEPGFRQLFTNEDLDLWEQRIARDARFGQVGTRVALARLDAIKGYEFDTVIIADLSDRWMPRRTLPLEEQWRDAARTYVAMTRAREELIITFMGTASPFSEIMRPSVRWLDQYDVSDEALTDLLGKR